MRRRNMRKARGILAVYLVATVLLLIFGYSVRKPQITRQEFPFTITYSWQGKTQTISDVYVAEYVLGPKYLQDDSIGWFGYIQDRSMLESDFYRIAEQVDGTCAINLNLEAGYLMGDPEYAGLVCQPSGEFCGMDGNQEIRVSDPAELEKLGFSLVSWSYPQPIVNRFSYGGISLSSEATMYTTALAMAALLACMILIRKEPEVVYGIVEKFSVALTLLILFLAFPFGFMISVLSEIVAEPSALQQVLYFAPAVTILGVAASVFLRRCGYGKYSLWVQLAGPVAHTIPILAELV